MPRCSDNGLAGEGQCKSGSIEGDFFENGEKFSTSFSTYREVDTAISWNVLFGLCNQASEQTKTWSVKDWISCLEYGTNKIRFEYRLDK